MKYFLRNILYFILVYAVFNIVYYLLIFKPAVFERYFFNENKISKYNLFLISDSHGDDIEDIPNEFGIFNFSNNSENYIDMYLKIKYLSNKLSSQDTILLTIDNHLLSTSRDLMGEVDKNIIYTDDFSDIDPSYMKSRYHYKKYLKYMPLCDVDFNKITLKFIYYSLNLHKMKAPNLTFSKLDSTMARAACMRRYKFQFSDNGRSDKQVKYLKKIIEICREHDITLIGIKFPIAKRYWDMIEKYDYGADAIMRENNIKIMDFHNLFFDNDIYFKDQDHLNTLGGKLFCQELIARKSKL